MTILKRHVFLFCFKCSKLIIRGDYNKVRVTYYFMNIVACIVFISDLEGISYYILTVYNLSFLNIVFKYMLLLLSSIVITLLLILLLIYMINDSKFESILDINKF